jgi:branched-chain amino acid transport system substrate-binding protein
LQGSGLASLQVSQAAVGYHRRPMRDIYARRVDLGRRAFLRRAACVGGALGFGLPVLGGCTRKPIIKIGYLTSASGFRASFSESADWNVARVRSLLQRGLRIGGRTFPTEIVMRDTQSTPSRAAKAGTDLLLHDQVDLLLADDGDSHYAVGDLCDRIGVPFVSTLIPWEPFLYARQSNAVQGFPWCFAFSFGAHDVAVNYVAQWNQLATNRIVGDLYLDRPTGHAFADAKTGVPAELTKHDYHRIAAGFYPPETEDFSGQVDTFKAADVQILSGLVFPSHFKRLWDAAEREQFRPEVCTVAAAFLFPEGVQALGTRGDGMSTEVWWTPKVPFTSSLTGATAQAVADEWESTTGRQWTQPIGYVHALFEVGLEALKRSGDPRDRAAVRDAIANLSHDTLDGPVNFRDSPVKSVAVTEMAMGQWRRQPQGRFPFELLITSNSTAPHITPQAEMKLLSQLNV